MKPGDLVRVREGYEQSGESGVVVCLLEPSVESGNPMYNVLFPDGMSPMFEYEMDVISDEG